ncbi:MAG: DUF1566 domain-containing protein [Rhodospirillales bacterium]|jgi:hypothetical protein|nr:DUF1566 domain-containing protein [Rhodospirillales bacterium]
MKPILRPLLAVLLSLLVVTSMAQAQRGPGGGQGRGPGGGPPPMAYEACQGKRSGDSCTINAPHGTMQGSCAARGGRAFCIPQGRGRAGGPGGGGGPGAGSGDGGPTKGGNKRFGYEPRAPYAQAVRLNNKLADTSQVTCFNTTSTIPCPAKGERLYGQDAHYRGPQPAFRDNGNGTVSDGITGLTWQKGHNRERLGYDSAYRTCKNLTLGGHGDWRMPGIKELFSITDWRGATGSRFFIDKEYFDLERPGREILEGDRFASTHSTEMMGQTWSDTIYAGKHWDRDGVFAAFFYNFLDGRIKQAPTGGGRNKLFYRCIRGPRWGDNKFKSNGGGTVTDAMTGLMWQRTDSGKGSDWPGALSYCENLDHAGKRDWRLPNARELQSIVDYGRADPALDLKYFTQSDKDAWFWSSTTFGEEISHAVYVCFGKCVSVEGVDVHGAGAQRSDPKVGNPAEWQGRARGGQRDETRIHNYARCVRDAG